VWSLGLSLVKLARREVSVDHAGPFSGPQWSRREIVQNLKNEGEHSQAEIAEMLGVSEATISDDLQKLNRADQPLRAILI
jgi:DNA-binding MarR family transcriptional regulator